MCWPCWDKGGSLARHRCVFARSRLQSETRIDDKATLSMYLLYVSMFSLNSPFPQLGLYSIPGSNCISTNTWQKKMHNVPLCYEDNSMYFTRSEGRRLKSLGGLVMTYLFDEASLEFDFYYNLI